MYELTKIDVAAMRQCDALTVNYARDGGTVCATKEVAKTERQPFAQDVSHYIDAPVSIRTYRGEDISHVRAYGHVRQYHGQRCDARSIIATLRPGDRIAFEFCAGGHSTDAMLAADVHGDFLRIIIRRKGQTDYMRDDQFTLTSRVGQSGHRMVMGLIPREAPVSVVDTALASLTK